MKLNTDHERYKELYRSGFLYDAHSKTIYSTDKKRTVPEGFEDWAREEFKVDDYLKERLKELGIKPKDNEIELFGGVNIADSEAVKQRVFTHNKWGDIEILQYSLKRKPYTYMDKGEESTSSTNKELYNYQTRLNPFHAHMKEGKYDFGSAKNTPFFHKSLIDKFENKDSIPVLAITEGQFKAFKACHDGMPTVGLTSISHFKDKKVNSIHPEIIELIKACKVERLVILWDGDCKDISTNAVAENEDLSKRPNAFYKYASSIREMILEFIKSRKFTVHFATIKTEEIDNHPKGIDDLLICQPSKNVVSDFNNIGLNGTLYFDSINITGDYGVKNMRAYFNLDSPRSFYQYHSEKIQQKDFLFFNTTYLIKDGEAQKKIDANVKKYKRIGIDYYKVDDVPVPQGKGKEPTMEERLIPWQKQAIMDDFDKGTIKHVERLKGFTNIPDHINYQQIVNGYWNLYADVKQSPIEGEFPTIEKLLRHIFRSQYVLALDWITILFRDPMQKLPIPALVSSDQGTGKSTFIYLLKLIFKQNMSLINSKDFNSDFNSHFVSKLIVGCEETFFDKKEAYESIKAMSTQKTANRNEKNKSNSEIPCFIHFVFCSNHEDDFMKLNDQDTRMWIVKVLPIQDFDKNFDSKLEDEICHFVEFISKREIHHPNEDRMWFKPETTRTSAFYNVVKNSEAGLIKELREHLFESFMQTGVTEQQMTSKMIKDYFGMRFELHYINKEIKRTLKLDNPNTSYRFFKYDAMNKQILEERGKGRAFTFKRSDFVDGEKPINKSVGHQTTIIDAEQQNN